MRLAALLMELGIMIGRGEIIRTEIEIVPDCVKLRLFILFRTSVTGCG